MAVERQIEDREIVKMFSARNQRAISETARKYGHMFRNIAKSILGNDQDAEECENDTYLRLWNAIPPAEPADLGTYGAVTVRNLAFDLLAHKNTMKRGGNMIFEELSDAIPDGGDHFTEEDELGDYIDAFLRKRKKKDRVAFILRYFLSLLAKTDLQRTIRTERRSSPRASNAW